MLFQHRNHFKCQSSDRSYYCSLFVLFWVFFPLNVCGVNANYWLQINVGGCVWVSSEWMYAPRVECASHVESFVWKECTPSWCGMIVTWRFPPLRQGTWDTPGRREAEWQWVARSEGCAAWEEFAALCGQCDCGRYCKDKAAVLTKIHTLKGICISSCLFLFFRPHDWCPHTPGVQQHWDGDHDRTTFHLCDAFQLHRPSAGALLQWDALSGPVQERRHLLLRAKCQIWHEAHCGQSSNFSNPSQLLGLLHLAGLRLHAPFLPVQDHQSWRPDTLQLWRW